MNHYYRSIWSSALNSWIAVAENTKRKTKSVSTNRQLLTAGLLLWSVPLLALPTGEQVVAGQVTISTPNAAQLQINQATPQAIVNWQNFSIQPHEIVAIQQPSINATLLNRVIGADASVIQGQLSANGQVFLINPNGVLFSPTAQVDVGGLIASTHAISNADFLQGHYHFTQSNADGLVNNQGVINVPNGGVVALIGSQVSNAGTITTPHGTTALAAGKTVDLDFQGDGLMAVSVSEAALNAQVENKGAILADGGRVVLTAQAAGDLIHSVVNHEGIIQARSLVERNGEIILAGGDNGATQVSGSLNVNGQTSGGTINVTGKNVTIAAKANITAQALDSGKAGNIAIFGDMKNGAVNVAGKLDASAPKTGDGGFIETSAAQVNIADSAKISTKAEQGKSGTWLIDPQDITVAVSGGNITGAALGTALSAGSVILDTSAAVGQASCSGAVTCTSFTGTTGDIFINDPVNWSANLLTLRADRNIYINRNLTGSGSAQLAFYYGRASASGGTNDDYFINGANVSLPAGANFTTQKGYSGTTYNYQVITNLGAAGDETTASTPATTLQGMARSTNLAGNYALGADILDASLTSGWNGGAGFSPIGDNTTAFSGQFDGLGHTITGLTISTTDTGFTGLFGYTSAASTISNIGLIGGNISANSSTSALPYTGGLVGENAGSIHHVYATSSVSSSATGSASAYAGGLVGDNTGSISNSYATGAISAVTTTTTSAADARAGGLVAQNSGSISNSYATGSVSTNASATTLFSDAYAGGLVGYNAGPTSNAYATGNVSATATSSSASASAYAGGLAGTNGVSGVITNGYATGSVTGAFAGGLVGGANAGTVTNAFWDTQSTGQADTGSVTGATGKITADMKQITPFSGAGWDISTASNDTTVWQINNGSSYPTLRSFITPTSPTVLSLTGNRVYDGTTGAAATIFSLTGLQGSDSFSLAGSASLSSKNAGTYNAINWETLALGSGTGTASDYTFTGGTQTVTITPAPLTINAVGTSKPYDATTSSSFTPTSSGLQTGDTLTGLTQSFSNKNVLGTNASTLAVNSGYSLNDGNAGGNYVVSTTTALGTITPANIAVNLTGTRVYDRTTTVAASTLSMGTLLNGETLTLTGSGTIADKNASTGKSVTGSFTPADGTGFASNYAITFGTQTVDITAASLTVSGITAANKVYDGNTNATLNTGAVNYTGLISGDAVNFNGTGTFSDKNVTNGKTVNLSNSYTGADVGNYNITHQASTTANITAKALTVSGITAANKVYDGNTSATPNSTSAVYSGLEAGDVLSFNGTGSFANKDVANGKTVTFSNNYTGADVGNYSITHQTTALADITAKALTVSGITAANKIYDGNTSATPNSTSAVYTGLVGGDVLSFNGTGSFANKDVANGKTVTLTNSYTGADVGNYSITPQLSTSANITAKALTVSGITAANKIYDGNTNATLNTSAVSYTGLIGGDSVSFSGVGSFSDKSVANGKTVNLTNAYSGADIGNYNITHQASTLADITGKALTVSGITAANKVYDGNTSATPNSTSAVYTGLVAGDVLSFNGTGSFANKDVATGKTVTFTNSYTGADVGNYSITHQASTLADITGKALTVSGITAANKVYDGNTSATPNSSSAVYTGLVAGDVLSFNGTGSFANKNVATGKTVTFTNSYTGADVGNYSITHQTTALADITPANLTLSTSDVIKTYDGNLSALGTAIPATGSVMTGDSLSGGTFAFTDKNAGTGKTVTVSAVTVGDGVNIGNYNVTYANNLTSVINKADLAITANPVTKIYDGTTGATGTGTVGIIAGAAAGEGVLNAGKQVFLDKNAGFNKTVRASEVTIEDAAHVDVSSNYNLLYTDNQTSIINKVDLTLTARDISKVYDGTTQAVSSAMISKGQLFSSDRLLESGSFAFTDKNAGTGKTLALANVAISDGNGGANYNVSYVNSNNSSITPAPLLLTANEVTKTYDGTTVANSSPVVSYGTLFGSDRVSGGSFAFTNKDTGTGKTVTVANVLIDDGNNGKNYSVDYLTNTTSTINKADLTLTAEDVSKMYDGTTTALGKALVSKGTLFTGDTLSGGLFAFVDKNAGTNKTVTVEGIQISDGNYGNNYAVSYADNTHSTIEQAPLTLSAKEVTKIYDGTVAAKGTAIVSSGTLFKGDTLTEAGFAFFDKNVGTNKTVTLSDLAVDDGNGGNNYKLTINDAIGAITPASLSITSSDVLKTYDATTQANGVATIKTGELFTGDTLSGGTFAFLDKNAGTGKTVTVKEVLLNDGNNGKNYQVSYVDNTSSTIDKANLTVTSSPVSKQYDNSTTAAGSLQLAAGKLYETDSLSGGSFTFLDKNAGSGKVVLTHDVSVKGSNNYALNYLDNTNSVITPAPLVLNAVSDSKVYDGTTDSSGVVSQTGLLNGDSLSNLSQTFASKNVLGANLSTLLVNNTYVLADGNGGKNYTVVSNTAKGSITPALLSVTTADVLKTYDETTVALGSPTVASGTLFTGDSLVGGKFAFLDAAIGINKTVTVADVSVNDGNQGKNYLLTFANNSKSSIVPVVTPVVVAVVTPAIFPDTSPGAAMAIANQNATFVAAQNAVIAAQKAAETSNPKERPLVEKMVTNSVASLVNANNTTNTVAIAPVIIPTTGNINSAVNNPSGGFNYQSNNPVEVDFIGGDTVSVASESSSDSTSATETASNNSATTEPDANESSDTSSAKLIGLSNALGSRTVIPTLTVKNSAGRVKALQLSENKNYVSLLLEDGSIRAWDFQRGVQRRITTQNKNNHLATIGTVNEKGELLSIASQAGIQTYDVVSSSTDASIASSTVNYFASSTDNQLLLTSHADSNQLSLWDNSQNKQLWQLPYQRGEIKSLAITKDKKVAAVLSHETGAYALPADLQLKNIQDAVDILDVASGKVITALPGFGEQVVYMQFQNEDTLQLALADGKVFNWSISTKKLENIANFAESILAVDIEKQTYAYILKEGSLQVGDGQGNIALKIENKENSFLNAKLLENGKRLLTVMENGDLAIWDVASGKKMLRLFSTKQGWTVMDALGRFDGSEEAMENFVWLADAEGMSLDSFSENYYEPGLLANVLQNQESFNDNAFAVTDGVSLPPKLALQLSDQQTDKDTVSLQLDVYDRGGGIKQLKVYQNERLLNNKEVIFSEQSATENGAEHKLLTLKVSPSAGKNSLKVVASNAMDIDSKGIELNFDGQSKAYTSSLKVLTIGINKYQEPQLHLNYSVADATLINDVLKSKAKISANKSLLDENATKAKILAELKELSQGTQQDSLVIYFAGHGVAKGREWYFLPYETKLESSLDKIVAGAISATELSDIFKNSRIQHILLMVDSCHSGGSMDVFSKLENGQRFFSRLLSRSLGITVLTAAARNQEAKELKSLGHGLFTYLLNEELQKSDAAEPITAHSIAKNILKTLPAFSKAKTGSSQEPVSYMHGGDFILSKSLDK